METYLIKSTLCLTLFLAFYHLLLEKEKMHQFNRFYLLGSILISFLTPLCILYTKAIKQPIEIVKQTTNNNAFNQDILVFEEPINYWKYVFYFSIIISVILTLKFIKNLYAINRKIKVSEKVSYKKATIVLVKDSILPHTFWNYIFINKKEYQAQKIEQELFTHELTHVAQKHTFDVLLIELLKIVFWFNPIFYFIKKKIQLNHEFIADSKVIIKHKNVSKYQHLLINTSAWSNEYALASNLHYLVTKKRIVMMTKQTSKAIIQLKKLAVMPLIIGAIFLFAEKVEAHEKELINKNQSNLQFNPFLITVKKNKNIINLKCTNNFRWSNINLDTQKKPFYIINDFGFSDGKTIHTDKFAMKVMITDSVIILKGLKGTKWKNLTLSLKENQKHTLDENGLNSSLEIKKSSKQSISLDPVLKNVKLKLKNVNALKLSIEKDSLKKPIVINQGDILASKAEIKEYKSILEKGKKDRLFKRKDILKMQYLYSLMSNKQKKTVESYKNIVPPPPPFPKVKKGDASSIPPPPPPPTKKSSIQLEKDVERGHFQAGNQTIYYVKENGVTEYYNRWGNAVNREGNIIIKEKNLIKFDEDKRITYFLDGKKLTNDEMKKINPNTIKNINVKKEADGTGIIYITTKKVKKSTWTIDPKVNVTNVSNNVNEKINVLNTIKHGTDIDNYPIKNYFLNGKKVKEKYINKLDYLKLESSSVQKINEKEINIYITTKK